MDCSNTVDFNHTFEDVHWLWMLDVITSIETSD